MRSFSLDPELLREFGRFLLRFQFQSGGYIRATQGNIRKRFCCCFAGSAESATDGEPAILKSSAPLARKTLFYSVRIYDVAESLTDLFSRKIMVSRRTANSKRGRQGAFFLWKIRIFNKMYSSTYICIRQRRSLITGVFMRWGC